MKDKVFYQCQSCGYQSAKWLGKCPDCKDWNTFLLQKESDFSSVLPKSFNNYEVIPPTPLSNLEQFHEPRIKSGIEEFDRVLGGGIVEGSMILVGGSPGIGKSTALLQIMDKVCSKGITGLYISGEESIIQLKMRASRLGLGSPNLYIVAETCYEHFLEHIEKLSPKIIVIDSIQTVFTTQIPGAPGSLSQVREIAGFLMMLAKQKNIPIFISGHVTKDGSIAGPKTLEHIVDTVLYFEGDEGNYYRILRTVKNRYGSTNEIGIFEMKEDGLSEVRNPSKIFLSDNSGKVSGSALVCSIEGTRPLIVELQALVTRSNFAVSQRVIKGIDGKRTSLLIAVLEKKMGLRLAGQDVFINVVGGVEIDEPASDLGAIMAIASSLKDKPLNPYTVFTGEAGLSGEIRSVSRIELRINEVEKLGYKKMILPESNLKNLSLNTKLNLVSVKTVKDALEAGF